MGKYWREVSRMENAVSKLMAASGNGMVDGKA
jgi:hypothetical protein